MRLSILQQTHQEFDAELLLDYRAIYEGGRRFKARIKRFLLQNDVEPADIYERRCREAHFRSYVGGIINQFASMLVTTPLEARAKDEAGEAAIVDEFYAKFKEDCDGGGTDLLPFIRKQLVEALVCRRAWWRIDLPTAPRKPEDRAEWSALGLGRATLSPVPCEDVSDWSVDAQGNLVEVLTYTRTRARDGMRDVRSGTLHEWRIYDATTVETFSFLQEKNEKLPEEITSVGGPQAHGFAQVPFVCFDVGEELWLGDRLASPQLEHFRQSNALAWSIRRTCYAMPVFMVGSDGEKHIPPTMGNGYYILIGKDEKVDFIAPPTGHLEVIRSEAASQKDEIYRVAHQMASGVENNAATVGRSGDSKLADAEATRIILEAIGQMAREAVEKTYQIITLARGEAYRWSIEGLGGADAIDPAALVAVAGDAMLADIPSPTFIREFKTRVALALVPGADEATKDAIRAEIEANVPNEPEKLASGAAVDEQGEDAAEEADGEADAKDAKSAAA